MADAGHGLKEVRELPALLAAQLANGEEVEECAAKPATSLGDNFGSTAIALDVGIRDAAAGRRRRLHAFCKMLPDDPERREIFCVDVTFVKEMQMYTLVVPAMAQLQRDCGVPDEDLATNLVPRCYGARCNLKGTEEVDDDAAIVLEDMRLRGFGTGDKVKGLDLEHAKLILEKLAAFQALAVALRIKRPQVYEDTVLKACRDFTMGTDKEDVDTAAKFGAAIMHNVDKSPEAARHRDAVQRIIDEAKLGSGETFPEVREPYASVLHNDLWTNNILVRRDEDGRPQAAALIDFQVARLNSPFKDVLFFLFTSTQPEVTASHLDEMIEAYHASFCRCLEQVGVDTTPFTLAAAWEEVKALARSEFHHIMFMLRFINADPAMMRAHPDTFHFLPELGGDNFARRAEHVVLQFAKRGWL
ncbi:hypothetical protein ONE63_009843 [Megalurothrips usitatus]|uniref:CHK kinase-like domain-containing protein n=1 Tax=Megalurothrips usitatus TaxID=439358 RepID=A0AAV7XMV4_9NEOP|nr:hypothetical protein ONE63_009843 [Megalurothrips usitatus]